MPEAPYDIRDYLKENLKYPKDALDNNVQGRLIVQFIVQDDGSVTDAKIVGKRLGHGCEEEAVRVVTAMPKWKPGKQNGRAVKVYYTLPVIFTTAPLTARNTIKELWWLEGKWIDTSDGKTVTYEVWEKKNDSTFSGKSFSISKGDTVFMEHLSLEQRGDDLFYIPTVSKQNNGKPVSFKLSGVRDRVYVFENKEHDFPQRICYSRHSADSILVYIEGEKNGVSKRIEFLMRREK